MKHRRFLFTLLALFAASTAQASTVRLQWTASSDPVVVSYRVYTSNVSGQYPAPPGYALEVPKTQTVADVTVDGGSSGMAYLVVTSVTSAGLESPPSNEVAVALGASGNRPPVLAAIPAKTGAEGALLSFTLAGSDADGDPLTYAASGLPTGATFNTNTGVFSWTPGYTQAGGYSVTFSVSDGKASASQTASLTVTDANRAPVLSAVTPKTVAEGSVLAFNLSASDADGDTLTYSATGLPAGATLNTTTGVFSWTPASTQSGVYSSLLFTVTDGKASASQTASITVTDVNRAPVLAAIGGKTVAESSLLTFTLSATDADADTLTYSATGLPSGATLGGSTGIFSWTPAATQAGAYTVTFAVSDGKVNDTEAVVLTVTDFNRPPALAAIAAKTTAEGAALSFALSGSDPDGDALTYSATGLPAGATFNTGTGAFAWTPTSTQAGVYSVSFAVSDGRASASQSASITVTDANAPPVLAAVSAKTAAEGAPLTFTLFASDADGDALTYSATGLPTGATLNASTGVFAWTPALTQSGVYVITFAASDGKASASQAATVTVTDFNTAPSLSAIAPKSVAEGVLLAFNLSATDPEGDPLTYTATGMPAGATLNATTGVFSWTPSSTQSGVYSVTFTVSDGRLSDSKSAALTVTDVNRAPALAAIPAKTVAEGQPLTFTLSATDADGDTLTFSSAGLPVGATLNAATGAFSWTPAYTQAGSYSVAFTVSDGKLSATASVSLAVTDANRPPVLTPVGAKTVAEGATLALTLSASDGDGDPLTYSATGLPPGATFAAATGAFSWTPSYTQAGSYSVTFAVSDGKSTVTEAVPVTVTQTPNGPSISAIGAQSTPEDTPRGPVSFTLSDPDTPLDQLNVAASSSNTTLLPAANVSFGGNQGARSLTLTPARNRTGSATVTLTVSDGQQTTTTTFPLTVTEVPDPPALSAIPDQTAPMNAVAGPISFTIADPDTSSSRLKLTASSSNAALLSTKRIVFGTSGAYRTIKMTPAINQYGTTTVTISASDGASSTQTTFALAVVNPSLQKPLTASASATAETVAVLPSGLEPLATVGGDLTGDGVRDVAILDGGTNEILTYKGAGNGAFSLDSRVSSPDRPIAGRFLQKSLTSGELVVLGEATSAPSVLPPLLSFLMTSVPLTPYVPADLDIGDIDGDGISDAVVARSGTNDAAVMLGTTDRRYIESFAVKTGVAPSAIELADFDADGLWDMAVANSGGNGVSLFLGTVGGGFVSIGEMETGLSPAALAVKDFDGDGVFDLAVANEGSGTVSVALGNGDGSFVPVQNLLVGPAPLSVRAGDVNGDARVDLVVLDSTEKNLRLLLGGGDGTFLAGPTFKAGTNPVSISLEDVNRDGVNEIAVSDPGAKQVLLLRPLF